MNPLQILSREHNLVKRDLLILEEMTYSPSVSVRDFSDIFKRLSRFWDVHEEKEEKLFRLLSLRGNKIPIEKIKFEHGVLKSYGNAINDAIDSGQDSLIKRIIKNTLGKLIDMLKAHVMAEDIFMENIDWKKIDKETIERIKLLQILPSDELLE